MRATKTRLTAAYRLSAVLAALLILSSVLGIVLGTSSLYVGYPVSLAGLVGQDVVTLLVGLPLLIGSAWLARRGSVRGLLAWAGVAEPKRHQHAEASVRQSLERSLSQGDIVLYLEG